MPIPGCRFKAKVVVRFKVTRPYAEEAYDQKAGANDHMEAVEACRHKESRAVDPTCEGEPSMRILESLQNRKANA